MTRQTRALVLFSYPFSPAHDSASRQMFLTLEQLRAFTLSRTFAALDLTSSAEQRAALGALGVHELNASNALSLDAHLEQNGGAYDLIWLSGVSTAMRHLRAIQAFAPHAKLVFDTTDLQHVRQYRRAKLEGHAGWLQMALKTKQWELAATNASHLTLAIRADERDILRRECPGANVQVHAPVHRIVEERASFAERSGILFTGSFPHHPNQDAMRYYLDKIHPRVQAQLDAPLYVVGPEPPEWLVARGNASILVTGHVPEMAPYLNRVRISIAPLRYGAGVKGKVLESMSYGAPVVGTTIAAEGIPARDGHEMLIADDPAGFAAAVVQLYRDRELWERLERGGIELVRRAYSPQAAQERLEGFLRELDLL